MTDTVREVIARQVEASNPGWDDPEAYTEDADAILSALSRNGWVIVKQESDFSSGLSSRLSLAWQRLREFEIGERGPYTQLPDDIRALLDATKNYTEKQTIQIQSNSNKGET